MHLLLGVLLEEESRGPELLRQAGVDLSRLTARLMESLGLKEVDRSEPVPPSGRTMAVLRHARQAASAYPPELPGTEHLLRAVLRQLPEWHELLKSEGVPVEDLTRQSDLPADFDPDAPPIPLETPHEKRHGILKDVRLYVLIEPGGRWPAEELLARAAQGGAQAFQLRAKTLPDHEVLKLARTLAQASRKHGVLFIVNDRPDIALLAEADGVHVGQEDLPAAAVRSLVDEEAIIGVSTHSRTQAEQAAAEPIDYIGVGPVFPSRTKQFEQLAGLTLVSEVCPHVRVPAFAIGGIDETNIGRVLEAGARRVAVCGAIASADDPEKAAAALRKHLDRYWA